MNDLITHLQEGNDLEPEMIAAAVAGLLDEGAEIAPRKAFLEALHRKGESPAEIAGFVRELLGHAVCPEVPAMEAPLIDVCGTGGDQLGLFNVSTASMFVVAAAGAAVVKHGNRGITSRSGGADVLEALGIRIDLPPDHVAHCLEAASCAFLFAPCYHPAFKAVAPVRKELAAEGRASIFNMLGPLLNPVQPACQLAGVFSAKLLPAYAEIFGLLGRKRAWAVHGTEAGGRGMDEVSINGPTRVMQWQDGGISETKVDPLGLKIPPAPTEELLGGDAETNAHLILAILDGSDTGPRRDWVALNAAAAMMVAGLEDEMLEAFARACDVIASGAALTKLHALREVSL